MDPNALLSEIIALANSVQDEVESPDFDLKGHADALATGIIELDHWLLNGGFKPDRWGGAGQL